MKVFLATVVSQTNGRGPRCTEADQAGIEAPVLSLELDDPLEEEDEVCDTAMVEAVSTVMNTVEASNQTLVGGPGQKQGSSFGQGALTTAHLILDRPVSRTVAVAASSELLPFLFSSFVYHDSCCPDHSFSDRYRS